MRSSWWRFTQPAKASTRKCRAWGMAGGYMAQTRPSPMLSRGFTRLDRFLADRAWCRSRRDRKQAKQSVCWRSARTQPRNRYLALRWRQVSHRRCICLDSRGCYVTWSSSSVVMMDGSCDRTGHTRDLRPQGSGRDDGWSGPKKVGGRRQEAPLSPVCSGTCASEARRRNGAASR